MKDYEKAIKESQKRKKDFQDKIKAENLERKNQASAEVKELLRGIDPNNIYVCRSNIPHEFKGTNSIESKYTKTLTEPINLHCYKVTVVGVTWKTPSGAYTMQIGHSKWNPEDNYSAQIGYQQALVNLIKKNQVDYTISGLGSNQNKEIFYKIAESIIDKFEEIRS
jgi:hypothetical protein